MTKLYETLGVQPNASQDDIRKAYRKAAKETHPDLNPGKPEAEKRFKDINAAYDIIGDADKRKRYDAGEIDETGAERQPERHFYREYAEADQNPRYSRRRASTDRQGPAGADFDYDIFAAAGINDGQVMRLKGQGLPGSDGKPVTPMSRSRFSRIRSSRVRAMTFSPRCPYRSARR